MQLYNSDIVHMIYRKGLIQIMLFNNIHSTMTNCRISINSLSNVLATISIISYGSKLITITLNITSEHKFVVTNTLCTKLRQRAILLYTQVHRNENKQCGELDNLTRWTAKEIRDRIILPWPVLDFQIVLVQLQTPAE